MSVSDGENVNALVTNAAYVSRKVDSNTVGKVDLENTDTASGTSIINAQKQLNSTASFLGSAVNLAKDVLPTWASNAIGSISNSVFQRTEAIQVEVESNIQEDLDIRTTQGTSNGDTDMGTFTAGTNGFAVTDNTNLKANVQEIIDGIDARILLTEKAAANGVATLDGSGRVPSGQLPLSATEYKGTWDANTNTPTLADGVGTQGDFWVVTVAGTVDLGSGPITFGLADWAFYNGSIWELSTNSVNAVGAATNLNNLVAPEVNVTLNPYADNIIDLGSSLRSWRIVYGRLFLGGDGTTEFATDFNTPHDVQLHSGHSSGATNTGDTLVQSGDQLGAATGTVGDLLLESGEIFNAANANDTGDVIIKPGLTAGAGARGKVKVQNGTEGTIGHVLTSVDANGSAEWAAPTGSGEGGINYIDNSDAEVDTTGWTLYNDGAVTVPVDGTGGVATSSFIVTTFATSVLRGTQSFNYTKNINTIGEGVSYDFVIDQQDRDGKVLNVSFEYKTDANYATSDANKVYIYDIDNSVLIGVVSNDDDGDILPSLTPTKFYGTFQTTDSDNYRLIIHNVDSVGSGGQNIFLDTVIVGPDTLVPGSIITDWKSFVPTGSFTTNTTYTGHYRQVGSSLECNIGLSFIGAPNATSLTIDLPNGLTVDSTKLNNVVGGNEILGQASITDSSAGDQVQGVVAWNGTSTNVSLYYYLNLGVVEELAQFTDVSPIGIANNDVIWFNFSVPVNEYSAGALLSTTEANFSTALAKASTISGSITNSVQNVVDYDVIEDDNLGLISGSGSSWKCAVAQAGKYKVTASLALTNVTGWESGEIFTLRVLRYNSSDVLQETVYLDLYEMSTSDASAAAIFKMAKGTTPTFRCKQGDYFQVEAFQNSDATVNIYTSQGYSYFSLEAQPDFSNFSVYGKNQYVTSNSDVYTPTANTVWGQLVGNSITLPPGSWMINGGVDFGRSGTANYTRLRARWASVNGDNTASTPTGLTNLVAGRDEFDFFPNSNITESNTNMGAIRVVATVETTVYLVPIATLGTFANGRINTNIYAERIA